MDMSGIKSMVPVVPVVSIVCLIEPVFYLLAPVDL
jgi:hypothetical protein